MDALMQMDLYELIGIESTATTSEIKKAYRKKALTCHPDKNLNNPRAAEIFKELGKALEILTDVDARAAYDKVIAARKQAKERIKAFDEKRKKFKEDLEAREEAYRRSLDPKSDENKLKAEIERLQKEGSKLVEEEIALVQKQIWEQLHSLPKDTESSNVKDFIIKIRWKVQKGDSSNGGYNYDNLYRMFYKYGDITALVVSKKKGRALIEFENKSAGETALLTEIGLAENPLTLCRLHGNTRKHSNNVTSGVSSDIRLIFPMSTSNEPSSSVPCPFLSFPSAPSDIFRKMSEQRKMSEFESSVLANLRRAEERKRLIEELKTQEET